MNERQLKEALRKWDKLKAEESKIKKQLADIKGNLMNHLEQSGSESIAMGDRKIGKKVSSHGLEVTKIGVKKTEATNDLTKELLDSDFRNLLSIKPKVSLLHQLQESNDEKIMPILKKHAVEVVEKYTINIE